MTNSWQSQLIQFATIVLLFVFAASCGCSDPGPDYGSRLTRMYLVQEIESSSFDEEKYPGAPVTMQNMLGKTKEVVLLGVVILKYDTEGRVTRTTHYFKRKSPTWDRLVDKTVFYDDAGGIVERTNRYRTPSYAWHDRLFTWLTFKEHTERINNYRQDESSDKFFADLVVDEEVEFEVIFRQNENNLIYSENAYYEYANEYADEYADGKAVYSATNRYQYGYRSDGYVVRESNREDVTDIDRDLIPELHSAWGVGFAIAGFGYEPDNPFVAEKRVTLPNVAEFLYFYEGNPPIYHMA